MTVLLVNRTRGLSSAGANFMPWENGSRFVVLWQPLNADVESLGDKVGADTTNIVASFVTFKHLYPDFGEAAKSAHRILVQGGVLVFDVPERDEYTSPEQGAIEPETGIFLRSYSRATIDRILTEAGFRVRYFSEITHMSGKTRLLVCAAKE